MSDLAVITEDQIVPHSEASPLPFIPIERQRIGWGGYSTVYKEIIVSRHFAYHQDQGGSILLNENPLPVARKRFPYYPDFEREYAILRYLKSARKPHERVVKHLAGVILNHENLPKVEHSLLFPLADMHLEQFMSGGNLTKLDFNALLGELFNLADALDYLHRGIQTSEGEQLVCWHMDLAPTNILIFNYNHGNCHYPAGIWKIADFSSSNLIAENRRSLLPPPKLSAGAYVAPEIHHKIETLIEKSCDIWSFGCILFDVLLGHFFGGENGLAISKYYFEENEDISHIAYDVSKHLNKTDSDTQNVILCKNLVSAVLKTNPTERPTAEFIKNRLASMITKSAPT
ncbi:kinase-like domain-containing protein [Talaromyces proteolyticus]|uniref:EKC/KEOPS complex subunit BUD32 n=1 Tax=Talaromyces proteolyticus TaxID=1131652 RepID=A0AAD4KY34_9EURO|nr:kinase-like domain-containing protein [Talaromyces proteolyticus]KAH8702421.1 kinase-like domain-containing protein [Talaromyces proteolyticus]